MSFGGPGDETGDRPTVAAFDFDGTVTRGAEHRPLPDRRPGPPPGRDRARADASRASSGPRCFSGAAADEYKEKLFVRLLRGTTDEELSRKGQLFAANHLRLRLRPEVRRRIEWHRDRGHRIVLVSASLEHYVRPGRRAPRRRRGPRDPPRSRCGRHCLGPLRRQELPGSREVRPGGRLAPGQRPCRHRAGPGGPVGLREQPGRRLAPRLGRPRGRRRPPGQAGGAAAVPLPRVDERRAGRTHPTRGRRRAEPRSFREPLVTLRPCGSTRSCPRWPAGTRSASTRWPSPRRCGRPGSTRTSTTGPARPTWPTWAGRSPSSAGAVGTAGSSTTRRSASPVYDTSRTRTEPKLVNYHNITPAELLDGWAPQVAYEATLGRAQLERLAPDSRFAVADSAFNESELDGGRLPGHRRRPAA